MNRTNHHRTIAIAAAAAAAAMSLSAHAWGQNFGPWQSPLLEQSINTPAAEGCPIESQDGRTLYIASNRAVPGAQGALDIYRFRRPSTRSTAWGPAENIGPPVNSPAFDYCPTPVQGKWLLFVTSKDTGDGCPQGAPPVSTTPGLPPAGDIYLTREHPRRGWMTPLHLGCALTNDGPNTHGAEFSPSLVNTAQGTLLYFSSNGYGDSQGHDIYVSKVLKDGTVTVGKRVAELSSGLDDLMPNVRKDGLEIVFSSNRDTPDFNQDMYVARRSSTNKPWSAPQRIDNPDINTGASETRASLSGDGKRLHFGRSGEIWVSTRSKKKGGD